MEKIARTTQNINMLQKIYRFAEWCSKQPNASNLWDAADVVFYQHLFDDRTADWEVAWQQVLCILSGDIINEKESLWKSRLTVEDWACLEILLGWRVLAREL